MKLNPKTLTPEQSKAESDRFWLASDDAIFAPITIAIVLGRSLSWQQVAIFYTIFSQSTMRLSKNICKYF